MDSSIDKRLVDIEKTLGVLVYKQDYTAESFAEFKNDIKELKNEMRESQKKILETYATTEYVNKEITGAVASIRNRIKFLEKIIFGVSGAVLFYFLELIFKILPK